MFLTQRWAPDIITKTGVVYKCFAIIDLKFLCFYNFKHKNEIPYLIILYFQKRSTTIAAVQ